MRKLVLTAFSALLFCTSQANIVTVTNLNDAGIGSLRDAITIVALPGDTIQFGVTGTINLFAEIQWGIPLTIQGPGVSQLTINMGQNGRAFKINGSNQNIEGLRIINGEVTGVQGGGAIRFDSDTVNIVGCAFENCGILTGGGPGGAIDVAGTGYLTLTDCDFMNCATDGGPGGAVALIKGGSIVRCNFIGNMAPFMDGGAVVNASGTLTVDASTFANNYGIAGGAINCAMDTIIVTNSTFYQNIAQSDGGAIFGMDPYMFITNTTFEQDSAQFTGSCVFVFDNASSAEFVTVNSIYNGLGTATCFEWASPAILPPGPISLLPAGPLSNGSNICRDNSMGSFLTATGDLNNTNPMLLSFGNYGGPTNTVAMDCNSPAFNAGQDTYAPLTDQRGMSRWGTSDIGAFEYQTFISGTSAQSEICNGGCDGITVVNTTGIGGPYTYLWNSSGTMAIDSNVCAGINEVTVTDVNGCVDTASATVLSPPSLMVNINNTNITCAGVCNALATANVTGGVPPYTYLWNNSQTTSSANGLCSGSISVTVTDSVGCQVIQGGIVNSPSALFLSFGASTDVSCNGACDGSIQAVPTGGVSPYWLNNNPNMNLVGLCAGTYTPTLVDANGCTIDTVSFTINEPSAITISINTTAANCGLDDGSATANASGGVGPYTYQWSSGDTTALADSITAGIYMVTVMDATGCVAFVPASVSNNGGAVISNSAVTNIMCNGMNSGAIDITVSGGTPPITYEWSNGFTTEDITSLVAGPYEVSVTDASGCVTTMSFNVTQPAPFNYNASVNDASCSANDGGISITVGGGTGPYTYNWSSGGTSSTETGLAAGGYSVTVTDASGCSDSTIIAVNNVGGPTIIIDSVQDATCNGGGGSIYISVSGGFQPYTYLWSNSSTSQDITMVVPGNHTVTATDSVGCSAVASIVLGEGVLISDSICLVTVDTNTNTNQVVWEKSASGAIDFYNIYKESTQAGVYYLIGSVDYDSLSVFTDSVSDPVQRSWRYKMSTVDTCGVESPKSKDHKTIHITISPGIGNLMNLIWDHYEGFVFSTYYIYRWTDTNNWELIDSLPNTLTSYTDNPPAYNAIFYAVEAKPQSPCVATRAQNYNSSRSNKTTQIGSVGIPTFPGDIGYLNLFPNPNNGQFTLDLQLISKQQVHVRVFDMKGSLVMQQQLGTFSGRFQRTLDLGHVESGIYFVQVLTDTGTQNRKVVIE